ncbi:MAG TPA: hypothetical protein VGM11_07850 [Acidobacteriaceae bacterium]
MVAQLRKVLGWSATLLVALALRTAAAQQSPAPPAPAQSPSSSLADILKGHNARRLHILYVHGIGDDGPTDRDSYYLRRGMCETLRCDHAHRDGDEIQAPVFANTGQFRANSTPPPLTFLGQPVFPVDASGHSEMWDASAPFFRRYRLTPAEGQPVYVDEINWWPLVFAVKCRDMVAADATLLGADKTNLTNCTQPKVQDPVTGHFSSYPFISQAEAAQLLAIPKQGAAINRAVKNSIMDWRFTDAVLSLGPMRQLLLDGLQQLIQLAVPLPPDPTLDPSQPQEFVIVTHSLGSYLIFAALDTSPLTSSQTSSPAAPYDFSYVLKHTSRVYFLANQLRLLEMANLDLATSSNLSQHLTAWVNARKEMFGSTGPQDEPLAQIVAWNDPSDLLTWEVPQICGISVENHSVKNSFSWFGLIESPTKAHDYYGLNKRVVHEMLHAEERPTPVPPCPSAAPTPAAQP